MLSNLLIYYISEVQDLWPSQNELYESICLFLERKQNATPYLWGGDNYIELLKFIPFLYFFCLASPLHLCTTLHVSPPCAKQKQYTVHYKGQLIWKCFLVSSFGSQTTDAQRGTNIQCTSKNSLPLARGHWNYDVRFFCTR